MIEILLKYCLIIGYVLLLIFLVGPLLNKITNQETSRKAIHSLLFMVWVMIDLLFKHSIHQIIIPIVFLVLNTLSYKFNIYKSVERKENNHPGTIYFAIAITIVLTISYFNPAWYYCSGIAAFCLTIGDGLAALVGYNTNSPHIRKHKTINGFLSCFAASFASLIIFSGIYRIHLSIIQLFALALLAAIMELVENGMDNFSVVAGTFLLSYAFMHYGTVSLTVSIVVAEVVFLIVFLTKAIDYYGSLLALGMVFAFSYFGGSFSLFYLLATYFVIYVISHVKTRYLGFKTRKESRTFIQIFINGGFGLLFVIVYAFTGNTNNLLVGLISIGGCFIDSLSSDVGVLSPKEPYDIIRWKKVPRGVSGGISLTGLIASVVGAAALSAALMLFFSLSFMQCCIVFSIINLQTLIDSVLGSAIQAKYKCASCGVITDQNYHCDVPAIPISGIEWANNNLVNFITATLITAISFIAF